MVTHPTRVKAREWWRCVIFHQHIARRHIHPWLGTWWWRCVIFHQHIARRRIQPWVGTWWWHCVIFHQHIAWRYTQTRLGMWKNGDTFKQGYAYGWQSAVSFSTVHSRKDWGRWCKVIKHQCAEQCLIHPEWAWGQLICIHIHLGRHDGDDALPYECANSPPVKCQLWLHPADIFSQTMF